MSAVAGEPRTIVPLAAPPDATVAVPGSKSLTNRALLCAALARGRSRLSGALWADDTAAMVDCLERLGAGVGGGDREPLEVSGTGGVLPPGPIDLDARLSGTVSRFLLPVLALGPGPYRLDGRLPLRRRPMGPLIGAVRDLGAQVVELGDAGHLPVEVAGGAPVGGARSLPGHVSSQFLSALLLAGPYLGGGLRLEATGPMTSRPYLDMTAAVMEAFGAEVRRKGERRFHVAAGAYQPRDYAIEPDASAASYFFAAAAITGGRVRVPGLGRSSCQGDLRLVDLLAEMGCVVDVGEDMTEVRGSGHLRGVDADLGDLPDMAPTVAAVAPFASSPTRVRGVAVIRHHETDRIAAVVAELRRCGIEADEHADGFTVHPGLPRPAVVRTYDDHRMAMSFALLGLRVPGVAIADPGVVAKTYPGFFDDLEALR